MKALIDIYVDKLISLGGRSSSIFMGKESTKVFYFSKYSDMINENDDTYITDLSYIVKQSNNLDKEIKKESNVDIITILQKEKKAILKFPKMIDTVVKESKKISFEKGVDTLCFGMGFVEIVAKDYVFRAPLYFEDVIVTKSAKKYVFERGQRKWNINLIHTMYLKIHGESLKLDLNDYDFDDCETLLKDMNIVDLVNNNDLLYLVATTQESLKDNGAKVTIFPKVITLGIYDSKLLTIYMETKKLAESGKIDSLNLRKIFDIKSNFELNAKGYMKEETYSESSKSIINSESFHNVTNVDFSQANVVQCAVNNTMVVKGPPGTGKTETILNILANNFIQGKKVLVVAEKLVALEVLYKRIVKNTPEMSHNTLFLKHFNTLGKLELIEKSRHIYNNDVKTKLSENTSQTVNYPLNDIEHENFTNYKSHFEQMANFNPNNLPSNYELINNNIEKYRSIVSEYDELKNIFNNYVKDNINFDTFLYNKRTYDLIYNDIELYTFNYQTVKKYNQRYKQVDKEVLVKSHLQIKDNIETYSNEFEDFSYMKEVIKKVDYDFYYPSLSDPAFNYKELKERYNSLVSQTNKKSLEKFYNNYKTHEIISTKFNVYQELYFKHKILLEDKNYSILFEDVSYYLDYLRNNDYNDKLHLLIKKKSYNEKYNFGLVNGLSGGFVKLKGSELSYYLELFTTFLNYHNLLEKVENQLELLTLENSEYKILCEIDEFIKPIDQFKNIDNTALVEVVINNNHEKNVFKYNITEYEFLEKYDKLLNIFEEKALYNYTPKELNLFLDYQEIINTNSETLFLIPDIYITKYVYFTKILGDKNTSNYVKLFNVSYEEIIATLEFNKCLEIYNTRKKQIDAVIEYRENITSTYHTKTTIAKNLIIEKHKNISKDLYSGSYSKGFFAIRENKERFNKSIRSMVHDNKDEFKKMFPIVISSPLNVASVLQHDDFMNHFDLVIFDEASQLLPEYAIYSLALGKDYIVVGDEKQLQPSNFFTTATNNEDVLEVLETSEDNESLLDIANRNLAAASKKMLNYHYRSENDLLIKFSNDEFYDSKLVAISNGQYDDVPFKVVDVNDATWAEQCNEIEAEKVVETILNLRLKYPSKTLGIITVNAKQASKIEELITYNLRNNKKFSKLFKDEFELSEDKEYIFIKNIENVQGDERDIVVFSLAYAKNSDGIINANYGSINRVGGANRLNVAFSRAKYKFVLVKSVAANELKVTNALGSILLHKFISFVEQCADKKYYNTEQLNTKNIFDSPFEEEVFTRLKEKINSEKYNIVTQYGSSGYTIDLVITNKMHKPILGIECDGATYHSSSDAKNRDYFRQKYLEDRGWNIHRIWSTNWWANREGEINKILKTLNLVSKVDYSIEKTQVISIDTLEKMAKLDDVSEIDFSYDVMDDTIILDTSENSIEEEINNIVIEKIVSKDISIDEEVVEEDINVSIIAPRDNITLAEKYLLYDELPPTLKTIIEPFIKKRNSARCIPAPRDNIKLVEKYAMYDEVISKLYAIKNKKVRKQITSSPEYDIMTAYKENLGQHEKTDKYIKLLMEKIDDKKPVKETNYISKKILPHEIYTINKASEEKHCISPGVYHFNAGDLSGELIVANTRNQEIMKIDLSEQVNEYDPKSGHKALVLEEGYIFKTTNEALNLIPVNSSSN